jgi:hypothetical protein
LWCCRHWKSVCRKNVLLEHIDVTFCDLVNKKKEEFHKHTGYLRIYIAICSKYLFSITSIIGPNTYAPAFVYNVTENLSGTAPYYTELPAAKRNPGHNRVKAHQVKYYHTSTLTRTTSIYIPNLTLV